MGVRRAVALRELAGRGHWPRPAVGRHAPAGGAPQEEDHALHSGSRGGQSVTHECLHDHVGLMRFESQ